MDQEIRAAQRLLAGHGALVLLAGFVMGFGFLFFLIRKVELWSIPGSIDYQLPGTYDAWRMAHMEGITNGALLWILVATMPTLANYFKNLKRLAVAMIIVAWIIVVASCLDPLFPDARDLALTPESNLASDIAFFLFYIGIAIVTGVVIVIAKKALFRASRS